jgi:hypothetical protein
MSMFLGGIYKCKQERVKCLTTIQIENLKNAADVQ